MNQLASLNSKLLATGKKHTTSKPKSAISNETIDLTMILFVFGCFFVLMFIILVLNSDYKNLDKYKHFSHDPEAMGFIDRLKTWFLCGQECKVKRATRTPDAKNNNSTTTETNTTPGLNQKGQCWSNS
jgi:hypothetical protein